VLSSLLESVQTFHEEPGVAEYWVVDVKARVIHQMWSPQREAYAERGEGKFGDRIEAVTIEGLTVNTAGIN
jgi:hypothetical protein